MLAPKRPGEFGAGGDEGQLVVVKKQKAEGGAIVTSSAGAAGGRQIIQLPVYFSYIDWK